MASRLKAMCARLLNPIARAKNVADLQEDTPTDRPADITTTKILSTRGVRGVVILLIIVSGAARRLGKKTWGARTKVNAPRLAAQTYKHAPVCVQPARTSTNVQLSCVLLFYFPISQAARRLTTQRQPFSRLANW